MSTRSWSWLLLAALLGCPTGEPAVDDDDTTAPEPADPFTLIVIPDIQYITLSYPDIVMSMFGWVADQRDELGIAFVLQEGDLTHGNSEPEWANADLGFAQLDGVVPYAVCVGNHDMGTLDDTTLFNQTFPVERFGDGLGGTAEPDRMDNAWFTFEAGDTDWLVISLTYEPDAVELAWALDVATERDDHRLIVLTHAYLGPDGTRTSVGERIWEGLVRHAPSATFVFNGHYIDGESAYLASEGDAGNTVHQLFANYQDRILGGSGLLRILTLDPGASTVAVQTYSPWFDIHEDEAPHQFVLENVDLGAQ
jgi:hypothetical protein